MEKNVKKLNVTPNKSAIHSVSSLIKSELHKILRDLKVSENVIKNCDIDSLVTKCLIRNAIVIDTNADTNTDTDAKDQHLTADDEQQTYAEQESIAAIRNKITRTALIIENFEILDERLTSLEKQFLTLMPNPSENSAQISTSNITSNAKQNSAANLQPTAKVNADKLLDLAEVVTEVFTENAKIEDKKLTKKPEQLHHTYFEDTKLLAMHQDQIDFNLLKRQKSDTTMRLNMRPAFNTIAPPSPDSIARYLKKFGEFSDDEN